MRTLLTCIALASLAACGVETATTAATSAEIKKREVQQGQKTLTSAQQKAEDAVRQMNERAAQTGEKSADKN
jgi:hypothetical protein